MQGELENIKGKFSTLTGGVAELFKVVLKTQNELFEKGKSDAYYDLLTFTHSHSDSEGRIDKAKLKQFLEEKIKEINTKDTK
jgi:hypothetical protein